MKTNISKFDNNYLTYIHFNTKRILKPKEVSAITEETNS